MSEGKREPDALPGHQLADRYVIEELVARGGMARVYRARDERLDRSVAVKVLASPFADDPAYVRRFLEEARIAASISHPNLAHVYDSGEDSGVQFIVLELLDEYRSLQEELAERERLPVAEATDLAIEVLAGLAPLHARGLVHCDVKARNILLARTGVKLIDFGIARPLQQASIEPTSIGSLHAMSPEQLRGEPLTAGSDIYAVGVVLYLSLTGRVPFPGDTPAAVAEQQAIGLRAGPSDLVPGIPDMLDAAVREALDPDPHRRFASAEAMTVALQAVRASIAADPVRAEADDDATTTFVPVSAPPEPARPAAAGDSSAPSGARGGRARPAVIVALLTLAMVASVMVIVAMNGIGSAREPVDAAAGTPTARATPAVPPGKVEVPDTIGMSEADAEAAARAAGLTWRLEWQVDPSKPAGVYDQEPAAGKIVDDGARFVMYAYRTR